MIELAEGFITTIEFFDKTHVLPGVALAYTGFYRSTIYGGYHRGLTTHVLREERFPARRRDRRQLPDRPALDGNPRRHLRCRGFYNRIEDFQIKGAAPTDGQQRLPHARSGRRSTGFEIYGRIDSQPFTGGPFNLFFEGNYTFCRREGSRKDRDGRHRRGQRNGNRRSGSLHATSRRSRPASSTSRAGTSASPTPIAASSTPTRSTRSYVSEEGEDGLRAGRLAALGACQLHVSPAPGRPLRRRRQPDRTSSTSPTARTASSPARAGPLGRVQVQI